MSLDDAALTAVEWFKDLHEAGTDLSENAHLKVEEEGIEYADDPSLEEAADVFIALVGSLYHRGVTPMELAQAIHAKVAINRGRTWVKGPRGTFRHS